jgi:hypothetical protein
MKASEAVQHYSIAAQRCLIPTCSDRSRLDDIHLVVEEQSKLRTDPAIQPDQVFEPWTTPSDALKHRIRAPSQFSHNIAHL